MAQPSSPYQKFMSAALASGLAGETRSAPAATHHTVRHQLVEQVAGNVFVFGVAPGNALAEILASKSPNQGNP